MTGGYKLKGVGNVNVKENEKERKEARKWNEIRWKEKNAWLNK